MEFDTYQKNARSQKFYRNDQTFPKGSYPIIGLVGEIGEVAEKVKKLYRDNNGEITPEFKKNLTKELGDVLWYLSDLCSDFDISLDNVAEINQNKIASRIKNGTQHGSGDDR